MSEYQKPWTRRISHEEYDLAVGIKKEGTEGAGDHDPDPREATGGDSST